jgi:tRNA1Val (adenine37-N6)-methyltransferase
MMTDSEIKWEFLSRDKGVFVKKGFQFNTDTIILADFSKPKSRDLCADFGTGCGAIPVIWNIKSRPEHIIAIDIQHEAVELLRMSEEKNKAGNMQIIEGDIRNYRSIISAGKLDLISCNPPYKAAGTGAQNADNRAATARHELMMTIDDLAKAAEYGLRFGGRLCICQRPERLTDVITAFRGYGLEPKKLRFVQGHPEKAPSIFLLESIKGGKPGLTVMPVLVIRSEGKQTDEITSIYGDYLV